MGSKASMRSSLLFVLLLVLLLCGLTACGGGDDEETTEFVGAARVEISTSPGSIDTGDRTKVTVKIEDVHRDGIILKVLYPGALHYVVDSARLGVGSTRTNVAPAWDEPADTTVDSPVYLVFFLARQSFKSNAGELSFELEALRALQNGEIGVDADVNDPLIDDPGEFDVRNPEFDAEASATITVIK